MKFVLYPFGSVSFREFVVPAEFTRATSEWRLKGQPWFYPRLVAYSYFWLSEGA